MIPQQKEKYTKFHIQSYFGIRAALIKRFGFPLKRYFTFFSMKTTFCTERFSWAVINMFTKKDSFSQYRVVLNSLIKKSYCSVLNNQINVPLHLTSCSLPFVMYNSTLSRAPSDFFSNFSDRKKNCHISGKKFRFLLGFFW